MPELAGLLDAQTAFPAGAWASADMLAALSAVGLQTAVTPAALQEAARHVEAVASSDPRMATARCPTAVLPRICLLCGSAGCQVVLPPPPGRACGAGITLLLSSVQLRPGPLLEAVKIQILLVA